MAHEIEQLVADGSGELHTEATPAHRQLADPDAAALPASVRDDGAVADRKPVCEADAIADDGATADGKPVTEGDAVAVGDAATGGDAVPGRKIVDAAMDVGDDGDCIAPPPLTGPRVTGTMLADLLRCEERVRLDRHGDPSARGAVSGFVEMLWRQGCRHEAEIVAGLAGKVEDLRSVPLADRVAATAAAMGGDAEWIVGARLIHGDIEGRPDLLHRADRTWFAGDVKSGGALAPGGGGPRPEYAVQTGLYALLLRRLGLSDARRAFVIGSDGGMTWHDCDGTFGRDGATLASRVEELIDRARRVLAGVEPTRPALSSICGLCVWRAPCRARLLQEGDITLVPGLGRSLRSPIEGVAPTIAALADLDIDAVELPRGRTSIAGVGSARLTTFRERARMLVSSSPPFAIRDLGLRRRELEHHLDLETDPTAPGGDVTYLHGIWRRRRIDGRDECDYVHFLAERPSEERDAFAAAMAFLTAEPEALLTTFSAFERSTYRRLAARYPEVVAAERLEALFAGCVDLYFDVVLPSTHWPVHSLGLKSLAKHLGFGWNDPDASGAASIQWYVDWNETRDDALLERILDYNRSDCIASAVVMDGCIALPVMPSLPWPCGGAGR